MTSEAYKQGWISVEEALPMVSGLYNVIIRHGSIDPKIIETTCYGKMTGHWGFKFCEGDWQKVTHWRNPEPDDSVEES